MNAQEFVLLSQKWVIDQAWDNWPSSVLHVYGKCKTTNEGQFPAILTKQASSIKDDFFFLRVIPSGQDIALLPAWVANHIVGFGLSYPLSELAKHIAGWLCVSPYGLSWPIPKKSSSPADLNNSFSLQKSNIQNFTTCGKIFVKKGVPNAIW